jgi:hypothetical protein
MGTADTSRTRQADTAGLQRRRVLALLLLIASPLLLTSINRAQIRTQGIFQLPGLGPRVAQHPYDGAFRFCRLRFRNSRDGDGSGWFVDYPRADLNLTSRLSELTRTRIARDHSGTPGVAVITPTDPELFNCPFVMMTEPGGAYLDEDEAAGLRKYLLKGGFLWADDFWGTDAWESWSRLIAKVLPPGTFPMVELPMSHPLYHTLFDIARVPQIPNVGLWMSARETSERGYDSAEVHARAILDEHGRVMVFVTHNTDFGDAYEEEAMSPDYFRHHSVQAYAIGVDLLLYSMTH